MAQLPSAEPPLVEHSELIMMIMFMMIMMMMIMMMTPPGVAGA